MTRRLFLLGALFFAAALFAREVIRIPRVGAPPASLKEVTPTEWQGWPALRTPNAPPAPYECQAYAAYDDQYLYAALEVELGRLPLAGQGGAYPHWNDGAEFRIRLPNDDRYLQLYTDAAGFANLSRRYKSMQLGDIIFHARATATGYSLFAAFPWKDLAMTPSANPAVDLSFHIQKRIQHFKFEKYDISVALRCTKEAPKTVDAKPVAPAVNLNPEPRILNFGRSGGSSGELLALLPAILDTRPSTAIIMIGTNDVSWIKKRSPAGADEKNLDQLAAGLRKAGVRTILVTIPPCVPEYVAARAKDPPEIRDRLNATIDDFNARVKRVAERQQAILVDYHAHFPKDYAGEKSLLRNLANSKATDGIHPTAEGYRLLARLLADAIRKNHLPIDHITCCGDSITYGAHMNGQGTTTGDTYPSYLRQILFPVSTTPIPTP